MDCLCFEFWGGEIGGFDGDEIGKSGSYEIKVICFLNWSFCKVEEVVVVFLSNIKIVFGEG